MGKIRKKRINFDKKLPQNPETKILSIHLCLCAVMISCKNQKNSMHRFVMELEKVILSYYLPNTQLQHISNQIIDVYATVTSYTI